MQLEISTAEIAAHFAREIQARTGQSGPVVEELSKLAVEMFGTKIEAVVPGRVDKSAFYPYFRHLIRSQNIYCGTVIVTQGWELASLTEEYWHIEYKVAFYDVAAERIVEIQGPKALELMQYLTPRDINQLSVNDDASAGDCAYVVILNEDAGNLGDPVMLRLGADHFWLMLASNPLLDYVQAIRKERGWSKEDVEVRDPYKSTIQVQGPWSLPVIRTLFGDAVANLGYYKWREARTIRDSILFRVMRTGYTGKEGFETILLETERAGEFYDQLRKAGEPYELVMTGPSDPHRTEAGMVSWNFDMGRDDTPFHTYPPFMQRILLSLEFKPKLTLEGKSLSRVSEAAFRGARLKPEDFMGKPVLEDMLRLGVHPALTHRLVPIIAGQSEWLADIPAREKGVWPVYARKGKGKNHVPAGTSRTLTHSGVLRRNIGYADLKANYANPDEDFTKPGTEIWIELPSGKSRKAVVQEDHRFRGPKEKGAIS